MFVALKMACMRIGTARDPVHMYAMENAAAIVNSAAKDGAWKWIALKTADTRQIASAGWKRRSRMGSAMPRKRISSKTGATKTAMPAR